MKSSIDTTLLREASFAASFPYPVPYLLRFFIRFDRFPFVPSRSTSFDAPLWRSLASRMDARRTALDIIQGGSEWKYAIELYCCSSGGRRGLLAPSFLQTEGVVRNNREMGTLVRERSDEFRSNCDKYLDEKICKRGLDQWCDEGQ